MAQFLQSVGNLTVGRGQNKQYMTPAQRDGVFASQPNLFGVQVKEPIPYQKFINDKDNMNALMKGYGEQDDDSNAPIVAQVMRKSRLISDAFNTQKSDSIYQDPQRNKDVNLYHINVRNERRDNLLSIQ